MATKTLSETKLTPEQDSFLSQEGRSAFQQGQQAVRNFNANLKRNDNRGIGDVITSASLNTPQVELPTPESRVALSTPQNEAGKQLIIEQERRAAEAQRRLDTRSGLTFDFAKSLEGLAGKTEFESEKEEELVSPFEKQLQGLNNRITQLSAEINQDDVLLASSLQTIEDKAIPMEFITGQQASVEKRAQIARALKVSEIGVLNAQVLASQGNIGLAEKAVERAVSAKYGPIEDDIAIRQAQLTAFEGLFSQEEQKEADALDKKFELQKQEITDQKDAQIRIETLAANASGFGADPETVAAISNSETFVEAINAAGRFTSDPLDRLIKSATLEESRTSIKKMNQEIADLNQPITIPTAANSFDEKMVKWINTARKDKDLGQGERESLAKAMTVVDQIDSLQGSISEANTGFFSGGIKKLMTKFAGDISGAEINAALQGIVPNIARGVFGEVGVLTDTDIENYKKTLPNLTSSEAQNDAILALTLKTIIKSVENQLDAAANSNVNVSGWVADYSEMVKQVHEIEDRIGISKAAVDTVWQENPDKRDMIMELFAVEGTTDRDVLRVLGAE